MCVWVMSSSVAKARCDVGDTGQDVLAVAVVGAAVPHLYALAGAGHDQVLVEARVAHQRGWDHQTVSGIEFCVKRRVEEEALQLPGLWRGRVESGQRQLRERLVAIGRPDRDRTRGARRDLV